MPGHFSKGLSESDSPRLREDPIVLLSYFRQQRRNRIWFPKRPWMTGLRGCLRDFRLYWMQMEVTQNGSLWKVFFFVSTIIYFFNWIYIFFFLLSVQLFLVMVPLPATGRRLIRHECTIWLQLFFISDLIYIDQYITHSLYKFSDIIWYYNYLVLDDMQVL